MKKPRILCPSPSLFSPEGLAYAREKLDIRIAEMDQSEFEVAIEKYDGALVRFDKNFSSNLIQSSKLKYIICPTTGLTHIDLDASTEQGVEIISLKGEYEFLNSIVATAEHTLTLLMALNRNIVAAVEDTGLFNWQPALYRGREVYGSRVGIIGMGRLGKIFADYCSALGGQIYYFDPNVVRVPGQAYSRVEDLSELTDICNVISVHVNLHSNNYKFLDTRRIY
jgi:D-3-phosphoglycerate dehydrogenase / 2-oxoglutarate reductase